MSDSYLRKPEYLAPEKNRPGGDDFSVLTDRETVQNIAKSICNKLRHPATIIDINRLRDKPTSLGYRIDSDIEYFSLRSSCRLLRHCAGSKICHSCDRFHASIFQDFSKDMSKKRLEEIISEKAGNPPKSFVSTYKNKIPQVLEIKYTKNNQSFRRLVMDYHCPLLGYHELLLPIFYDGITIGVLFLGQTIICDEENDTKETMHEFFKKESNKPEIIFKDFLYKDNQNVSDIELKEKANEIKNAIINADTEFEKLNHFLKITKATEKKKNAGLINITLNSYSDYKNFIKAACKELDKVELDLVNDAKKKREKYFEKILNETVKAFFDAQPYTDVLKLDKHTQRRKELKSAWDCFLDASDEIKEKLGLSEVLLFGDGVRVNVEGIKNKRIYSRNPQDKSNNKWKYDYSNINELRPTAYEPIISLKNKTILKGLHSSVDKTNVILLVFPDIVVLLRVNELIKHEQIYIEMTESIGKGFSRIYSEVALRAANFMKEQHVFTLRMYRHESAHISSRLGDNMKVYFAKNNIKFLRVDDERKESISEDMKGTVRLISHMANNIGVVTGSINYNNVNRKEKKKRVDIFDLLYKWQIMFRSRLIARELDIEIVRNSDDASRYIKTNPDLFELLMYNLVDNAVKYANRGSIIRLSWCCLKDDPENYELTVSSYGQEIKQGDRLYELYVRGYRNDDDIEDNNKFHAVEGDGMGLFVVKRISKLLDLKGVSHTCDFISKYHVPLISWYLEEAFEDMEYHEKKKIEIKEYMENLNDIKLSNIINNNEITKIKSRNLTEEYLDARIDNETWLTEFKLKVPKKLKVSEAYIQ